MNRTTKLIETIADALEKSLPSVASKAISAFVADKDKRKLKRRKLLRALIDVAAAIVPTLVTLLWSIL
jgi:hypothetical protein